MKNTLLILTWLTLSSTSMAATYISLDSRLEQVIPARMASSSYGVLQFDLSESEYQDIKAQGYQIEPDARYSVLGHPSAVNSSRAWASGAMRVAEAHELENSKGEGVKICLLDTGIDSRHSLLKGKVSFAGSMVPDESASDNHGHGTHVASLMVGSTELGSPAPAAKIVSFKVLDQSGTGSILWITRGIFACREKGAQIINLSLGSSSPSDAMQSAINQVRQSGLIVVAAAGNDGGPLIYPAAFPGVHSVGALNSSLKMASFSNRGEDLDYVSPGEQILGARAGGGTITYSGTSMACPFVAGMFALKISRGSSELRTRVLSLPKSEQGKGLVDAAKTARDNGAVL